MENFGTPVQSTDDPRTAAALIDVVSSDIVYLCYPAPGTIADTDETWAIKKVELVGTEWTFKWAGGTSDKKWAASDRLTLTYQFLRDKQS